MLQVEEHHQVDVGSERSFGIVFCILFLVIFLWPIVLGDGAVRIWAAALSGVFLVVSFAVPSLLKPLNKAWFAFGMFLGKVVAPIVMMLVFAMTVTPIGVIARLMGKDLLFIKKPAKAPKSFWISREGEPKQSMKNQF